MTIENPSKVGRELIRAAIQSQKIRAKWTVVDIRLATERAEKFLVERYPTIRYDNGNGDGFDLLAGTLADYDLHQLDEMFNDPRGEFRSEPNDQ
jgi:hypothetical protein